ncbi:MAG: tail fiber domain-containing protein [Ginsengibacter sp.]
MKKIIFCIAILGSLANHSIAQSVGIGTTAPDASAILELKATNKGFLPPRMTASEKGLIPSPKAGLLIYQTDATPGLYVYNGSAWVPVAAGGTVTGGWALTGNAGTNPATNYIGTNDDKPLMFRINTEYAGQISNNGMVAIGTGTNQTLSHGSIVAIGKDALYLNGSGGATGVQGLFNTAVGSEALTANTKGLNNTATGYNALFTNTIGIGNTANGSSALLSNTSGNDNTALGNQSLFSNKISGGNTAIGVNALYSNIGSLNTAVGNDALKNNTTGISNTAIGSSADVRSPSLNYATAIGAGAKVDCSECLVLGDQSVNVGIGIEKPTAKLHVNPDGAGGIYIGGNQTAGGYTGLALGVTNKSGGGASIQATQASGNNYGNLLLNPSAGNVGIGFSNPTSVKFPLHINQNGYNGIGLTLGPDTWDIYVGTQTHVLKFNYNGVQKSYIDEIDGSYNTLSDKRFKKNITPLTTVLDKVMALTPKNYKYISNENTENADKIATGFIAQEVMPLFPNLVSDFTKDGKDSTDKTVYHGINYAGFSVIAIKAIQEQQVMIEAQQKQIDLSKRDNATMMEQIKQLQNAIAEINKDKK